MATKADLFCDIAVGEIGVVEQPAGSNSTKYGVEYGLDGVPWCCQFVWWVARRAGLTFPHTAYVPTLETWARTNGFTVPADQIRRGDVICLDFTDPMGDGADHVEIALSAPNGMWVDCVGGNTSDGVGSIDNGGGVYRNLRRLSWVSTAVRLPEADVQLDEEEEFPMLYQWMTDDGTIYLYDTLTGRSVPAQAAFAPGTPTDQILAGLSELKTKGVLKDLGALSWDSNWVLRTKGVSWPDWKP